MKTLKKQQGAVLFIAIALLLIITIVGVSSVSISGMKTQIAGNSMFTMLTYQGAESALAKSLSGGAKLSMTKAAELGVGVPYDVPNDVFTPAEVVSGGVTLSQKATVTRLDILIQCPPSALANSAGLCYIFETNAQARLNSTGAKASHAEGWAPGKLTN